MLRVIETICGRGLARVLNIVHRTILQTFYVYIAAPCSTSHVIFKKKGYVNIILSQLILDKHTWVCSICGQGLTRKSTANRHNNNLHLGGAMIVRPYEYIIGRLNGKFLQSDPSLYRHKNGSQKSMSGPINHPFGNDNRMVFGALSFAGNTMHKGEYGETSQQITKFNGVERSVYAESGPPTPSHKVVDVKTPDTVQKLFERTLKLKETEILLKKHYRPEDAKQIISATCMQVHLGDDDSLDTNLTFLRNMDRARSY